MSRESSILAAAVELIAERGFAETRVADVAQRAGVSGGLVVYYYGGLDALLVSALLHSEDQFYGTAESVSAAGGSFLDRVEALVELALSSGPVSERSRVLWLETWTQALHKPAVADARREQDRRWRGLFAELASAAGAADDDAFRFASGITSLLDGLCIQITLGDDAMSPELAKDIALRYAESALPVR